MTGQIPVDENAVAAHASANEAIVEVLPDIGFKRLAIVNASVIGPAGAGDREWVLVDAGLFVTSAILRRSLEARFGASSRPAAIIMTHAHADHAGGLKSIAEHYDAPVFAHRLELPYLNGSAAYPPPDAKAGGGLMSLSSPLFSRGPFDVSERLHPLPEDGSIPHLPGWKWIHTPGHTVGHVSFWREADRVLLAGDAFVLTNQESAYSVAVQEPELHGPPMYYTSDWEAAEKSVRRLAELAPEYAIAGHGPAMKGESMRASLTKLAATFRQVAVPEGGRYVRHPAKAADGSAYR